VHHSENELRCASNPTLGTGNMDIVSSKAGSKASCCAKSAVISLGGQELCLDHFLASCYARLDTLEPVIRGRSLEGGENLAARASLEECSNRALLVCLRHESLTNLDRSRLLDILLLSGDLQLLLHKPSVKITDTLPHFPAVLFWRNSRQKNPG
jgi:hypothetical protein